MPFSEEDLDALLDAFDAKTVTVKLGGAVVGTIRGAFRRRTEFVGQAQELVILPSLLCKDSDLALYTRAHTLGVDGTDYRQFGAAVPNNSGLSRVGLVK